MRDEDKRGAMEAPTALANGQATIKPEMSHRETAFKRTLASSRAKYASYF